MFGSMKKNFSFLIGGLLISGMVFSAWVAIVPFRDAILMKMDTIQRYYADRENREQRIARLPELAAQSDEIKAGQDRFAILLKEDRIVDFVKTIEGLASETGTKIEIASKDGSSIIDASSHDQSQQKPTASKSANELVDALPFDRYIRIDIRVVGTYGAIVSFLHKLETLPYGLDVVALSFHSYVSDDKNGSNSADALRLSSGTANPFVARVGTNVPIVAVKPVAAQADLFQAVFDTIVYIDK
jgi:hypothetical protein